MDKIINELNIDESLTKPIKKPKSYDKVKENIPLKEDYNFMADLLILPKTSKGNLYLLVVVDLASDEFDIEPLKNKKPQTVLKAMKKIFKRKYLNKPYASITTDQGTEFKGIFHKYLYDNSIFHKQTLPGRHTQLSNVERLNRTLGRLLNGYMNTEEKKTGKPFKNWDNVQILNKIRTTLNKYRKKRNKEIIKNIDTLPPKIKTNPKFKKGDIVHIQLNKPKNALGNTYKDESFRMGDLRYDSIPRKIKQVLVYNNGYRYLIEGIDNASYTENQLLRSKEKSPKYAIKKIIGKKKIKGRIHYLIHWKNYKKSDATWEPRKQLIEDGLKDMIKNYENKN